MLTVRTVAEGSPLPSEWSIDGPGSDPHQVPGAIIPGRCLEKGALEYISEGPLVPWWPL